MEVILLERIASLGQMGEVVRGIESDLIKAAGAKEFPDVGCVHSVFLILVKLLT